MNTGDRELLELAAKVVGITPTKHPCRSDLGLLIDATPHNNYERRFTLWNPLTSDGDALRLAHALRINFESLNNMGGEHYGFAAHPRDRDDCGCVELGGEISSLRRAIVRAAAEIGRQMTSNGAPE